MEALFEELAPSRPPNVSYLALRLEDGSFVHISFHDHGDDEVNPISATVAFSHFQQDHADRRSGQLINRPPLSSVPTSRRSSEAGTRDQAAMHRKETLGPTSVIVGECLSFR